MRIFTLCILIILMLSNSGLADIGVEFPIQKGDEKYAEDKAALLNDLKNEDPYIRLKAVQYLANMKDASLVKYFEMALNDPDIEVRCTAISGLGNIDTPQAISVIIKALKDSEAIVREEAVWVLELVGDERAIEPLISLLSDPNPDVQAAAAGALASLGAPKAVPRLIDLLKSNNYKAFGNIIGGMMHKGHKYTEQAFKILYLIPTALVNGTDDKRVIGTLITFLSDKSPHISDVALVNLKRVTGEDFSKDQKKWQEWWEQNKR